MRSFRYPTILVCITGTALAAQEPHPVRQLTDDPAQQGFPSWSPDGTTIVHSTYVQEGNTALTGLWLVPAAGGEGRQLTTFIGEHPDWSPDGQYIVFDAEYGDAIKLVAASGGQPIRVVPASIPIFRGGNPNWSPDGTRIAFKEGSDLWVLDVRTGEARIVLSEPGKRPITGCWSPDGSEIYSWVREEESPESTIVAVSATGDERREVASDSAHAYRYMDLSPDGSLLAFASRHDDNVDLWVMSPDGGAPVRLTSHPAYDDTPRWSPDGTRIAFTSTRSGSFDVWVVELDLKAIRSALSSANP
jgi:Tol biopolymer transport system component